MSKSQIVYGIDFGGFQSTGVVKIRQTGREIIATPQRNHPFNEYDSDTDDSLKTHLKKEVDWFENALKQGNVIVDAPINLEGLPIKLFFEKTSFSLETLTAWQLRARPIDLVLGGQSPLFSFLGNITLRIKLIQSQIKEFPAGKIFESYPKASRFLSFDNLEKIRDRKFDQELSAIFPNAQISIDSGLTLNVHELDAIWCALAGLNSRQKVSGHEQALSLKNNSRYLKRWDRISGRHKLKTITWPDNYVLFAGPFDEISKFTISG